MLNRVPAAQGKRGKGEVFRLQAKLRQHILHGNAFAVLGEPGLAFAEAAAVFLSHRFIIGRSQGGGAGDRIQEHELQKADGGRDLGGRQPLDELVRLLPVGSGLHISPFPAQRTAAPFRNVSIVRSSVVCLTGDWASICSRRRSTRRLDLLEGLGLAGAVVRRW